MTRSHFALFVPYAVSGIQAARAPLSPIPDRKDFQEETLKLVDDEN